MIFISQHMKNGELVWDYLSIVSDSEKSIEEHYEGKNFYLVFNEIIEVFQNFGKSLKSKQKSAWS